MRPAVRHLCPGAPVLAPGAARRRSSGNDPALTPLLARDSQFPGARRASQPASRPAVVPESIGFDQSLAAPVGLGETSPRLRQVRETDEGIEMWWHGEDSSFFHYEWLHR